MRQGASGLSLFFEDDVSIPRRWGADGVKSPFRLQRLGRCWEMQIDIADANMSTKAGSVGRIRPTGRQQALREEVADMMTHDAKWLESSWCDRLKGSVWTPRNGRSGTAGGLVAEWLDDFSASIGRDLGYAIRTPDAGTDNWISGSNHHRVETVYRIAILSMGRDVIEDYLNESAFPRLDLDVPRQDSVLDDLDAAFRHLTHQHIQQICEWLLHVTRLGLRTGVGRHVALR